MSTSLQAAAGPSLLWRFLASTWLLLLLAPAGALAWLGFGILAVVGRRRSWMISAVLYAVAALALQLRVTTVVEILQGTLYLVALGHGLLVNQRWLLLLWSRNENDLTVFGTRVRAKAPKAAAARQRQAAVPKEAEKLLGGTGTSRSDYVADEAPAPTTRRRRFTRAQRQAQTVDRTAATPPAAAAPAVELVDVNTANQRALARLTGIDRALAKTLVTDRTKRGGFGSLEDFAATAGLQPHQIVRLRDEAFCSPRPRSARSFGRRVDY
jgi:DNA uptake protein ComE-like DNA-binding protein